MLVLKISRLRHQETCTQAQALNVMCAALSDHTLVVQHLYR